MEKGEVGILIAFILGVFVIGFYGKVTGNAVNGSIAECNVADFNADGKVDYRDKVDFAREYDLNYGEKNYCGFVDVNEDGILNILDSNRYSELYAKNYGTQTGDCVLRKLACEVKSEPITQEQTGLSEEKPSFFKGIKDFFKSLF